MGPDVKNVFNKLSEDKIKLSAEKIELSLQQVDRVIKESASQAKYVIKLEQKIEAVRKELKSVVGDAKSVLNEMDKNLQILMAAGPDIQKIKKDMQEIGVSTAPLDARYDEIKDSYKSLAKFRNILNRQIITATNI